MSYKRACQRHCSRSSYSEGCCSYPAKSPCKAVLCLLLDSSRGGVLLKGRKKFRREAAKNSGLTNEQNKGHPRSHRNHNPQNTTRDVRPPAPTLPSTSAREVTRREKVLGVRRIWGTMKTCTAQAVKITIMSPDQTWREHEGQTKVQYQWQ